MLKPLKLKYLIVGTGRCGTAYITNYLNNVGIICGHESIFTPFGLQEAKRRLSNPKEIIQSHCFKSILPDRTNLINIVAESSYMSAPYLNDKILDNVKIIHLVRHPLQVINSFVYGLGYFNIDDTYKKPHDVMYHDFIYSHLPEIKELPTSIERACRYYFSWNKIIEDKCNNKDYFFQRIEDNLDGLNNFLGIVPIPEISYDPINMSKYNKEEGYTANDLSEDVKELAIHYKYEL